jgi:hypothetical protein
VGDPGLSDGAPAMRGYNKAPMPIAMKLSTRLLASGT